MENRIGIEVNGQQVILHFGMTAVKIWQERAMGDLVKIGSKKKDEILAQVDNVKSFAYVVFAGMCNYQDTLEKGVRPSYTEAYAITEDILFMDEQVQIDIWTCFENSRAYKLLLDRLHDLTKDPSGEKKSVPVKRKSVAGTK